MKKFFSLIFASAMLIAALHMSAIAAKTNAIGDVNGDGKIQADDARLALRAAVKIEKLSDTAKKAADVNYDGAIKSDDARLILRAAVGLEKLQTKYTAAELNAKVNTIKTNADKYTFTNFVETVSEIQEPEFKGAIWATRFDSKGNIVLWPAGKSLEDQFKEEFKEFSGTTKTYEPVETGKVSNNKIPVFGQSFVSNIADSDVEKIISEYVSGLAFVSSLPDTFVDEKGNTNSLKSIKAASYPSKVEKITVTLKALKYSDIKNSTANTGIAKIYAQNYKELLDQTMSIFNSMANDPSTADMIKLKSDIISKMTVTFYLNAETGDPISAVYNLNMTSAGNFDLNLPIGNGMKMGSFSMNVISGINEYYFFNTAK